MKARMEELSLFYSENLDDEKIIFFEKLRLKIKKSLHNKPGKRAAEVEPYELDSQLQGGFNELDQFDRLPLTQQEKLAWERQAKGGRPLFEEE